MRLRLGDSNQLQEGACAAVLHHPTSSGCLWIVVIENAVCFSSQFDQTKKSKAILGQLIQQIISLCTGIELSPERNKVQ